MTNTRQTIEQYINGNNIDFTAFISGKYEVILKKSMGYHNVNMYLEREALPIHYTIRLSDDNKNVSIIGDDGFYLELNNISIVRLTKAKTPMIII
jgi:hypothetical protein